MVNQTQQLVVSGMTCEGCVAGVTNAINDLDGIIQVNVSLKEQKVVVTFDDDKQGLANIIMAIEDAGFDIV